MGYGHVELPPKGVVVAADFGVALLKLVKFAAGRGPYLAGGGRAPVACRFGPAWPLAEGPGPCKVGKEPSAASRPVSACNLTAGNQMTAAVADTLVQRGLAGHGGAWRGRARRGVAWDGSGTAGRGPWAVSVHVLICPAAVRGPLAAGEPQPSGDASHQARDGGRACTGVKDKQGQDGEPGRHSRADPARGPRQPMPRAASARLTLGEDATRRQGRGGLTCRRSPPGAAHADGRRGRRRGAQRGSRRAP
jgi:hypothetical protein